MQGKACGLNYRRGAQLKQATVGAKEARDEAEKMQENWTTRSRKLGEICLQEFSRVVLLLLFGIIPPLNGPE